MLQFNLLLYLDLQRGAPAAKVAGILPWPSGTAGGPARGVEAAERAQGPQQTQPAAVSKGGYGLNSKAVVSCFFMPLKRRAENQSGLTP